MRAVQAQVQNKRKASYAQDAKVLVSIVRIDESREKTAEEIIGQTARQVEERKDKLIGDETVHIKLAVSHDRHRRECFSNVNRESCSARPRLCKTEFVSDEKSRWAKRLQDERDENTRPVPALLVLDIPLDRHGCPSAESLADMPVLRFLHNVMRRIRRTLDRMPIVSESGHTRSIDPDVHVSNKPSAITTATPTEMYHLFVLYVSVKES